MPDRIIRSIVFAFAIIMLLAGCSPRDGKEQKPELEIEYVKSDVSYDQTSVSAILDDKAPSGFSSVSGADAPDVRHDVLAQLRRQGEAESSAASLITATFPTDAASVPFKVIDGMFKDEPVLIMLEAVGPKDGKLHDVRLWVIAKDGQIRYSDSR